MVIVIWWLLATSLIGAVGALWAGRRLKQIREDDARMWREFDLRYGQTGAGKGGG